VRRGNKELVPRSDNAGRNVGMLRHFVARGG
jgi:hypothetical protein